MTAITLPWWIPLLSIAIALFALGLAIKNYRRKSGLQLRGNYQIGSDNECYDSYISQITIENIKDRSVTIFAIYLRIGHNYFIELENFVDKPMTLKAYETYHKEYGAIQFYAFNTRKFNLNTLLDNHKVKKRLVLSTGDGKYTVPKPIKVWNPATLFFENHMTAIIKPIVMKHKEKNIGSRIKYVVTFTQLNAKDEVILIAGDAFRFNTFKDFRLTKEAIESKENLGNFFGQLVEEGKIRCQSFTVNETSEWMGGAEKHYQETIEAQFLTWFSYYVTARFLTWIGDKRRNKRNIEISNARKDA